MSTKHLKTMVIIVAVASMSLTSCTKLYYQVYDVNSNLLKQENNSMIYENHDIKVMYNLWGENGKVGFIIHNKTEKNMFIDMKQTFFILNGEANDYFRNSEWLSTNTTMISSSYGMSTTYLPLTGFWPMHYYVPTMVSGASQLLANTTGVTTKEKEIVCIPANSYKVISKYTVSPKFIQTCNRKQDFPSSTAKVATYTEDNSPVKFKNRIAYSFDNSCKDLQHVENGFYISGVTNYSKKAAVKKIEEKANYYDTQKQEKEYFKIGGPNKFYKTYKSEGSGAATNLYE